MVLRIWKSTKRQRVHRHQCRLYYLLFSFKCWTVFFRYE